MRLYATIVALGLAAIVGVNRAVDVAGLQTFDQIWALAIAQRQTDLLVWDTLFDQRAWLKARLVTTHDCPEVLILGSSTTGALRAEMFAGRKVLNGWMSAPTVEDFEAVTAILERVGCTPRELVLGVDPWLLNERFGDDRWLSLLPDYVAYQPLSGKLRGLGLGLFRHWQRFKERLNFTTTRATVAHLWRHRGRGRGPELVHEAPEALCLRLASPHYIRAYDGHYESCPSFVPSTEAVAAIARSYVAANTHEVLKWRALDAPRLRGLRAVLRRLASRGTRVLVLATPFHPLTYRAMREHPSIAARLVELDHALGGLSDARYLALRDPAIAGCAATEFEDSHHAQPSCAAKIASRIVDELR